MILLIFNAPAPELDRFTVCATLVVPRSWLGNDSIPGDALAMGAIPVPVRETVCVRGWDPLMSLMVSVAV